jgi:hypothetical protein
MSILHREQVARNSRLRLLLRAIRANATMPAKALRVAIGLGRFDSLNALLKYAKAGYLTRVSPGVYSAGPNAYPAEGTDAWLLLQQLKHGPLTVAELADLLECSTGDVEIIAHGFLICDLLRRDSNLIELACGPEWIP